MKRNVGYAILLLMLATGLSVVLPAQQPSSQKSDQIDPSAMDALSAMGAYLRSLRDFQVTAAVPWNRWLIHTSASYRLS